jgi:hypothetical protein
MLITLVLPDLKRMITGQDRNVERLARPARLDIFAVITEHLITRGRMGHFSYQLVKLTLFVAIFAHSTSTASPLSRPQKAED